MFLILRKCDSFALFIFIAINDFFFSKFVNKKIINVICTYIFLKNIAYFIFQKMQNPVRIFIEFYPRKPIFKGIFNIRDILKKWKKNIENIDIYRCFP